MIRRIGMSLLAALAVLVAAGAAFAAQPQTAPDGFVPVTGVPVTEQIPAAPLVVGTYAFFLLLMVFYLWTIWRRIGKVEEDMRALQRRQGGGSRN